MSAAAFNQMFPSMMNGGGFGEESNHNLPVNRFAIETAPDEIQRNRTWAQIMDVCDKFKAAHPDGLHQFAYKGFECQILFCRTHFNGYIQMTQEQRYWFEANRALMEETQSHGGITCESAANGCIGFGFNCAHMGDQQTNPLSRAGPMFEDMHKHDTTFKTPEYVAHELRVWADYLASILPPELS